MHLHVPFSLPRRPLALALTGALALGLVACGGSDDAPSFKPIELNIAHINDHHSQLDAFAATELTLDGVATQVELGGFARQTA
ncbi:MAG TPA: bifunctional metallophosphatase/5'-nucleotidase, partial [Acidovorax sp.]|nr:bifunctional metallophosphatase/5'-nucleotidase [Acidovorax sp.]